MRVLHYGYVVLLGAIACRGGEPAATADSRTPLPVPAEAASAVRAEMRTMLSSLQAILVALPARDTTAVRVAATAAGMAAAADAALESLLPEPFLHLGVATHQGFDSLAVSATRGLPTDSIVARLGRVTANCIACHGQYRLVVN